MTKIILMCLSLGLAISVAKAQSFENNEEVQSGWSVRTHLSSLLGAYEYKVAPQNTLEFMVGLGGQWGYSKKNKYNFGSYQIKTGGWFFACTPAIMANFNHYYNFQKRNKKGKMTLYNSANFVALRTTTIPGFFTWSNKDAEYNPSFNIDVDWGLRRYLGANFTFELELGLGYSFVKDGVNDWYPKGNIQFSYHF